MGTDLEKLAEDCANNSDAGFNRLFPPPLCIKVCGGSFKEREEFCSLLAKKVTVAVYPVFVDDPNDKASYYIYLGELLNKPKNEKPTQAVS